MKRQRVEGGEVSEKVMKRKEEKIGEKGNYKLKENEIDIWEFTRHCFCLFILH
jgi:hypothetical protein